MKLRELDIYTEYLNLTPTSHHAGKILLQIDQTMKLLEENREDTSKHWRRQQLFGKLPKHRENK